MGIPGLIITEEMVPHLQEMLISAGIEVKKETYAEEDSTMKVPDVPDKEPYLLSVPNFCLHCENKGGERVRLTFGRLTIEPYYLSIAMLPLPQSLWKTFVKREKNKLVDQTIAILKENGAKEFDELLCNTDFKK